MERTNRLNRRMMLKGTLAAGSAAVAALLAACGSSGGSGATDTPKSGAAPTAATTGTTPASTPATTSAGKTIAELKVAVAALPDAMDPQESISNVGMRIHYFTFDTLIRRDFFNNNMLVPSLATEWKRTDDKTLEMTLRKDVTWHDGT